MYEGGLGGSRVSGSSCLCWEGVPSVASCLCLCACPSTHLGHWLFRATYLGHWGSVHRGLEHLLVCPISGLGLGFAYVSLSISVQARGCVCVCARAQACTWPRRTLARAEHMKLVDWQAPWGPGDGRFGGEAPTLVLWPPWIWAAGTGLRLRSWRQDVACTFRSCGPCHGCKRGKPGHLGGGVPDPLSSLSILEVG